MLKKFSLLAALLMFPLSTIAADAEISSATVTATTGAADAVTSIAVTFTTTEDHYGGLDDGRTHITVAVITEAGDELYSDLDFSGATYDLGGITSYAFEDGVNVFDNFSPVEGLVIDGLSFALQETLPAGTYTITLDNVVNASEQVVYAVGVNTTAGQFDSLDPADFTFGVVAFDDAVEEELEDEEEVTIPSNVRKQDLLSYKKKASGRPVFDWKNVEGATYYKVRLDQRFTKNNGSEVWKKVKVFGKNQNITASKRRIKTKFYNRNDDDEKYQQVFRFRVRACNEAGCSAWSKGKQYNRSLFID